MTKEIITEASDFINIPFKMHPRVFAALGADLVTNDVVAVIELVKNSYDAYATSVLIKFGNDPTYGPFIEILDNGSGMSEDTLKDVWCTVATPFRIINRTAKSGVKERRVSGEKGLGRLSVARLGSELSMLTKTKGGSCWDIRVNWAAISGSTDINQCFVRMRKCKEKSPFTNSGTLLRIYGLKSTWNETTISELQENLARLISPFLHITDFEILLSLPGSASTEGIKIESPVFLAKPKYLISGNVDKKGLIRCIYKFSPIKDGNERSKDLIHTWEQVYDLIRDKGHFPFSSDTYHAGAFSFEIRAWDIGPDDAQDIADRFDFQKSKIRKTIKTHKGISVYRDNLLVLPKSDDARDWLGLDLRRISKVGTRLGTSQIVGYVSISAERNPSLVDTSNREGLASNLEVAEFQEMLKAIVFMMENERDIDRSKADRAKPLEDLFSKLDASKLVTQTKEMIDEGVAVADFLPVVTNYASDLELAKKTIQERFVYYSRLATVGTIAHLIVHEIRNRTTSFGAFLDLIMSRFGPFNEKELLASYTRAQNAIQSLERLSDTFLPLASRGFRKRQNDAILEERINGCLSMQQGEIAKKNIDCKVPSTITHVAVDPGELDAIILNLTSNAIYWLGQVEHQREISFNIKHIGNSSRVQIVVSNNGPRIEEDLIEKIFWPGVTRKPGGIGMGLVVASELVAEYGGKLGIKIPSDGQIGAKFVFDIPLKN